jgi:hypothetical protein
MGKEEGMKDEDEQRWAVGKRDKVCPSPNKEIEYFNASLSQYFDGSQLIETLPALLLTSLQEF